MLVGGGQYILSHAGYGGEQWFSYNEHALAWTAMLDVIGFGAVNQDEIYVVPSLADLPQATLPSGSEQTITRGEYEELTGLLTQTGAYKLSTGGGQAANTLYALARIGFSTGMIGSAGSDAEGDSLVTDLSPVDTSQIARGGRTARCVVILENGQERTMRVLPAIHLPPVNALSAWDALGGGLYLHLTSLAPPELIVTQVELLKRVPRTVKLSFDPNELYCRLGLSALAPILNRVDVLFLNENESRMLTGSRDPERFFRASEFNIPLLVHKKGPRGAEITTLAGEHLEVPAKDVATLDPTGAGDVFAAGFLAGLLLGLDLKKCALLASKAAAQSVTGYGRSSYPGPELLDLLGLRPPVSAR
ncbi:MAG: carbohydrate kinase family protein [Dehalococcoidia bacterium]